MLADTNVLSELLRVAPDPRVLAFADARPRALFTAATCVGELLAGAAVMPEGARRRVLVERIERLLRRGLAGRVLPFDAAAARHYAEVVAARRRAGRPAEGFDAQIAAVARAHRLAVATRNTRDFEGCGVEVVDPWAAA